MTNPYEKDYDTLLSEILTDYANLDDAPGTSEGDTAFIMGAVLASVNWGQYKYQQWISEVPFPDYHRSDTDQDTEIVDHWASIYELTRTTDETNTELVNRILTRIRQAPAGGNPLDFETWALDQDNVSYGDYYNGMVTVVRAADGPGTIGVYTIPDDETIIADAGPPNNEELLRQATETYLETMRPGGTLAVVVVSAQPSTTNVSVNVEPTEGGTLDTDAIEAAIESEMETMKPGESLHRSIIEGVARDYGAAVANMTFPADAETEYDNDEFCRPATVTITEV